MDLNFQNFETTNSTNEQSGGFGGNIGDTNNLFAGSASGGSAPFGNDDAQSTTTTRKQNLFSFDYYQQFFDVETDQVIKRLINSVIPTHRNYIQDFLQPIPDLWGPFWVSVTLVFAIGIFGNLAQFIENDGAKGEYGSDFRMVTSASTLIFLYVVVVPLLIYGLLWNRKSEMQHPYVDLVCLYGYSLSIFIPVTFLWIIDIGWFRWALIFASVGLSGTVLVRAIWPAVKNDTNKMVAFGTIGGIVLLHFLLAFTFKEFYFDAMHPKSSTPADPPVIPVFSTEMPKNESAPEAPHQILNPVTDQPKMEKRNSGEETTLEVLETTTTTKVAATSTAEKENSSTTTTKTSETGTSTMKDEETTTSTPTKPVSSSTTAKKQ